MKLRHGRPSKVPPADISEPVALTTDNFRYILTALRKEENYSQEELGNMLGVRQATVRNWEYGIHTPTVPFLLDILDFYGYKLILTRDDK